MNSRTWKTEMMKNIQMIGRMACMAGCLTLSAVPLVAQESTEQGEKMIADVHPMAKDAMDMKKAKEMASPAMLQKAKEQVMATDKSHQMLAMETVMASAMRDGKTAKMVQEHAMAPMPDGKPLIRDEQIKAAIRKVFNDPAQFQALLQTLILRETAANPMMEKDHKANSDAMMIPEADMKSAKKELMGDEAMTMKIAKEMMMHAMLMDQDIRMAIKEAAMKPSDPAMEKMMKSDGMMMTKQKMLKEPSMKMEMAKEAMIREMAKPASMVPDKKK